MKQTVKFLSLYGLVLAAALLVVMGFNLLVDPYQIGTGPSWPRFNAHKHRSHTNVRQAKAINVKRLKPRAVVLGNSRADIGIDPEHPALTAHGNSYNLAIPASDMVEILRFYRAAVQAQPELKAVVLGIDFVAFGPNNFVRTFEAELDDVLAPGPAFQQTLQVASSHRTLLASAMTLAGNFNGLAVREHYRANGHLLRRNPPGMTLEEAFGMHLKQVYLGPKNWYSHYELSERQMQAFQTLVADCQKRGIELKVFISPAHAMQWEALHISGQWLAFERWKRAVAAVTPVWDFSGYNAITSEPLTPDMRNYIESSHYLPHVGDWVLDRMFGHASPNLPADFGVLLTADVLENHLRDIRQQRQRWVKASPGEHDLVRRWRAEAWPGGPVMGTPPLDLTAAAEGGWAERPSPQGLSGSPPAPGPAPAGRAAASWAASAACPPGQRPGSRESPRQRC